MIQFSEGKGSTTSSLAVCGLCSHVGTETQCTQLEIVRIRLSIFSSVGRQCDGHVSAMDMSVRWTRHHCQFQVMYVSTRKVKTFSTSLVPYSLQVEFSVVRSLKIHC